jgi:hypothetical protein
MVYFGIAEIRSSDMRTNFLEIVRRVTPWIRTRLRRRLADEERCTLKDIHSDIDMKPDVHRRGLLSG